MQDQNDEAFLHLMRDAAHVGMSAREIVDCFSEWLLIDCWRFDGKDIRVFGNFRTADDEVKIIEEDGNVSFQGRLSEQKRVRVLEKISSALENSPHAIVRFSMPVGDGPVRDFISIARSRSTPDGADGLIGVSFECFKPLRQVAFAEARDVEVLL